MTNKSFATAKSAAFDLETFTFNGKPLQTVVIDGIPWFVANEVFKALDLAPNMAAPGFRAVAAPGELLLVDPKSTGCSLEIQRAICVWPRNAALLVSESGVYKFILRTQPTNPAARDFQDWVTKEVLPRSSARTGPKKIVTAHLWDRSVPTSETVQRPRRCP